MSSNNEYEQRRFWNYELSPFDGSILHEGEEYDRHKRDSELIASYYAKQPPQDDNEDKF